MRSSRSRKEHYIFPQWKGLTSDWIDLLKAYLVALRRRTYDLVSERLCALLVSKHKGSLLCARSVLCRMQESHGPYLVECKIEKRWIFELPFGFVGGQSPMELPDSLKRRGIPRIHPAPVNLEEALAEAANASTAKKMIRSASKEGGNIRLTRSRWEKPAFNCGFFRPNTLGVH